MSSGSASVLGLRTDRRGGLLRKDGKLDATAPNVNPEGMKLPLRLYQYDESFGIRDAEGYSVCYLYFDDDPKRRIVTKRMTKAEAESVAKQIARALTDNAEKAAATPEG